MRKIILGSSLIISSLIGMAAMMLSHAVKVDDGYSYKGMIELIFERPEDAIFFVGCMILLIVGVILGVCGLFATKE